MIKVDSLVVQVNNCTVFLEDIKAQYSLCCQQVGHNHSSGEAFTTNLQLHISLAYHLQW